MRTTRLYHPNNLECGSTIQLTPETSNHLIRVLRTKQNSLLTLFNGDGYDYQCKTVDINSKHTSVHIETKLKVNNESGLSITLLQGLSRQDRMDTTVQKSVELGVNKIIPVMCQRSNIKINKDKQLKKYQHWNKVAISACEQSGRCVIPQVTEIATLDKLDTYLQSDAYKITLNPKSQLSLKNEKQSYQSVEIFIGPEGGITDEESQHLKAINFNEFVFGPRILRTETAGPAVISALQILWGDF